jgi:endonuclease/exonuclease/phosphatase family metal-dependent hydrolase
LHSYSLCFGFSLSPPPLNNRLDMIFRIATLNLEQNHKCWEARRELIVQQWGELGPDMLALNEIYLPEQTGRWLQRGAVERLHMRYTLLQQSKVGEDSHTQAEGLLTRYPVIETANLDYRSHNCVALAARFEIDGRFLDVYVTHLIAARVEDAARQYQVGQLREWIRTRDDADFAVVCGDFNAAPDQPSIRLMSGAFRPTQIQPTAFTPLQEPAGSPSHPEWERFDRCIDYIWVTESIKVKASGLCFNRPAPDNPALWPSDHVGVWADLELS